MSSRTMRLLALLASVRALRQTTKPVVAPLPITKTTLQQLAAEENLEPPAPLTLGSGMRGLLARVPGHRPLEEAPAEESSYVSWLASAPTDEALAEAAARRTEALRGRQRPRAPRGDVDERAARRRAAERRPGPVLDGEMSVEAYDVGEAAFLRGRRPGARRDAGVARRDRAGQLRNAARGSTSATATARAADPLGLLSPAPPADDADVERRLAARLRAALGRRDAPTNRGLRVLSLDGGGSRGVITIQLLKELQARAFPGREPSDVFDLVVGTSTGAILAVLLGAKQCSLDVAARLYDALIDRIFVKEGGKGDVQLVLRRARYDENHIEDVLRDLLGDDDLLDAAEAPGAPEVAILSTLLSVCPATISLLRSYEYPDDSESRYPGTCQLSLRSALRAATAAPTLFTPLKLKHQLLCDGALIANNPSAVAIHEAGKLFPGVPIDAVVSVGTGEKFTKNLDAHELGWDGIVTQLIDSATSTTLIHDAVADLAPPGSYFRFSPNIHDDAIDTTDAATLATYRADAVAFFADPAAERQAADLKRAMGL
ncbi:calcium-independent phospholipase [Aureococcus anophagefferens]|uniref:Calcium-independent phospholipase n=2 Tax=Aureococcus anophagefferens TaxID=44056 RepID=A0ABR1G3Q2_AURAN